DQYLQEQNHLVHPRNGGIGGLGSSGLGHGYIGQLEWMNHPNSFMMPPQHLYGQPQQFGQYGHHHRGLNEEEEESEGETSALRE
ncbi:hypothetical protein BGZ65_005189, partial [Modicella reniformis]